MKKIFTNPSVKKVEFELTDRIAASGCGVHEMTQSDYDSGLDCWN